MAKDPENPNPKKLSWADQMEHEENMDDLALSPLPPRQVIGPDENGIKKVIEYKFNEAGNTVKVTSTFRVHKVVTKMSKGAIERRSWAKFGDAVDEEVGSKLTVVSTEEIFLERPRVKGVDETRAGEHALDQLGIRGGFLMLCRTCGKKGEHLTARCPYKDILEPLKNERPKSSAVGAAANSYKSNSSTSRYVPPSMREGGKKRIGTDMRHRNEETSIWITNLPQDAKASDLRDLFGIFGPVTRIYVAPDDRQTGLNRGFAFVSFLNKEDAERAINNLNGYGYGNLILNVEWSLPRSK
ncbi:hypothetical protein REPUB_Repub05bG0048600 [Reevesia pubescens]